MFYEGDGIMDDLREYLIGVIAAALLCAFVSTVIDGKSTVGVAAKLLSGVIMLLTVLSPWVDFKPDGLFRWADDLGVDGSGFVSQGENLANTYYRDSIKQRLESYILDEAKAFNCALTVEIILSDLVPATPEQIRLSGDVSPYARQVLTNELTESLGLSREDLIWT